MRKPFWLIDGKLREADFFLGRLRTTNDLDEARFYFSAFLSAARSVTFALQVCLKEFAAFDEWYEKRRNELKADSAASYLHTIRNQVVHVGLNPLGVQTRNFMGLSDFFTIGANGDDRNVITEASRYMALLVRIARDAYQQFWANLDLSADVTLVELAQRGITLERLETEFGLPEGWSTGVGGDQARLDLLKGYSKTDIQRLCRL